MNKNNVVVILVNVWVQITNLVINIMCVKIICMRALRLILWTMNSVLASLLLSYENVVVIAVVA